MCGIAGIITWNREAITRDTLMSMGNRMETRGPDDYGIEIGEGWGMVHRRLSIIDLSPSGHQPMTNESGDIYLIFNGEIYNFQPLRDELVNAGHIFTSNTDSEVLIHGYEEWGESDLLQKITGMFAFALWDNKRKRLILARDRHGQKPLFIYENEGRLVFASTLPALQRGVPEKLELNRQAVLNLMAFRFIPEYTCITNGVRKLPPAHFQVFEKDSDSTPQCYWSFKPEPKLDEPVAIVQSKIKDLLLEAVEKRLFSDVPLGAFLSGGVDSRLVAWAMKESLEKVHTYTIAFEDHPYDESNLASQIAKYLGTEHTTLQADPKNTDLLTQIARHTSEPFGDSSILPSMLVAQLARQHVTVALTGDGGDELFAGYLRATNLQTTDRLRSMIGINGGRFLHKVSSVMSNIPGKLGHLAARGETLSRLIVDGALGVLSPELVWEEYERFTILAEPMRHHLQETDPITDMHLLFDRLPADSEVERQMWHDAHFMLPGDYLVKVDNATMTHSLEARSPFLDQQLWEYAVKIPTKMRMLNGQRKGLLWKLAKDEMPGLEVQKGKYGFRVPVFEWIGNEWNSYWRNLFTDSRSAENNFIDEPGVQKMLQAHAERVGDFGFTLWNLGMLELWLRENGY
ncbi:asparagine synthase (glutamine-hydrolyzing) [bacterium]|nr:asparagine synthase (glutamine-hydrolyzing) [bacterium]